MRAYERLLKYVVVRTPSKEESHTIPTSSCQFDLAHSLVQELKDLGVEDARVDKQCYVYAHIPASPGFEGKTRLGFIAHMDTVSDFCDHDIVPIVTENYNGEDFVLGTSGRTLRTDIFKHLPDLKGRTLITSDGTTILGADDKAGIAEIMTVVEHLLTESIPHGPISVAFTPDEEVGTGASHFNVEEFGAQYGYTLDGSTEGEIQFENFNACKADFEIQGVNVHPGSSKNTMVNASLVAMEINSMLPCGDTPRDTEDYEGFYHLVQMSGEVGQAKLQYMIRDHNASAFALRQQTLLHIEKLMNEKWGQGTVKLTITQQYHNMAEIIENCSHLIDHAKTACENVGIDPIVLPIRGGTDGSQLSFKGLPCPNLGTGGYGFHGPYEHITAEGMDTATQIVLELIRIYAQA